MTFMINMWMRWFTLNPKRYPLPCWCEKSVRSETQLDLFPVRTVVSARWHLLWTTQTLLSCCAGRFETSCTTLKQLLASDITPTEIADSLMECCWMLLLVFSSCSPSHLFSSELIVMQDVYEQWTCVFIELYAHLSFRPSFNVLNPFFCLCGSMPDMHKYGNNTEKCYMISIHYNTSIQCHWLSNLINGD